MSEQHSSYRQILRATSLFGGVQIVKAVVGVITSKIIAVLLGPAGMGIYGLLNSSLSLITSLSNFGLGTSAVKTIASLSNEINETELSKNVTIVRKLTWLTGLLGSIITLVFSKKLSLLTFGNTDYTVAFALLSVTILFNQLSTGQISILQGLRKHKHLANAIITGSIAGLIVSIPIYYFFRINGIVTAIIITSAINLLRSWYFSKKIEIKKIKISFMNSIINGKEILKMGFLINLSGLITTAVAYATRVYIAKKGSVDEVGLYNAGFLLINGYVGLIFSAMATDYFPRLTSCKTNLLLKKTINEQAEIMLLLLSPILILFFLLNNYIIIIFYSKTFLGIKLMLFLSLIGMVFRAASWSISFIYIARGDTKLFFFNELIANIYFLILNIYFYKLMGISGLGLSFLIGYFIYFFHMYILMKKYYNLNFNETTIKIIIIQLIFVSISFLFTFLSNSLLMNIVISLLLILNTYYSVKELNNRTNLTHKIKKYLQKL